MKNKIILLSIICCLSFSGAFGQSANMDKELSDLTEKLAAKIKAKGKKKVTVVDFTDLQGSASEFGRYVAEQLTLDLVTTDRDFAVLDRAHRNNILTEHNLTAKGLVDPSTAKQFAQFTGVDALILGSIVTMSDSVQVTSTIITTDTAEVIGGGKASFAKSKDVQELLDRSVEGNNAGSGSPGASNPSTREFNAANTIQKFGNFTVEILSFRILPNNNAFAALQVVNTSRQNVIGIGANTSDMHDFGDFRFTVSAMIIDDLGNQIRCLRAEGLHPFSFNIGYNKTGFAEIQKNRLNNDYNWVDKMTEIKPGESLRFTLEFATPESLNQSQNQPQRRLKLGAVFKLQAELITIVKKGDNDRPNPKLENVFIDKIIPTKPASGEKAN